MKAYPDCLACVFRQALNTAKVASPEPAVHEAVLRALASRIPSINLSDETPAVVSQHVYDIVTGITGNANPYKAAKKATNEEALRLLPRMREILSQSENALAKAVHMAAAGNIIDYGISHTIDVEQEILSMLELSFAIDNTPKLERELGPGKRVLYVCDNAGEIVFDRLLMEELRSRGAYITACVKSGPIINDAAMEDAIAAGIPEVAEVIESGTAHIGIIWSGRSPEFDKAFRKADVVISKGQGNFETLSELPDSIYYLLKAKCGCVAAELGVSFGDIVFKKSPL